MDFTINRNELLEGIGTVLKAVTTKGQIDILSCILVKCCKDGIKLTATDLEIGIETCNIPAVVKTEGAAAIEGKLLSDMIKLVDGEEVNISTNKKKHAMVKCGRSEYKIACRDADDFPSLPAVEKGDTIILSQGLLKKAIKQTIFSISPDESKPTFTGVLFEAKKGAINLVSVDGFRISYRKLDNELNNMESSVIVPGKSLAEIHKLLLAKDAEEVKVYPQENHILFDLDRCTIVSRLISGLFFKYESALNIDAKTVIEVKRLELLAGIEQAALIAPDQKKIIVSLTLQNEKLTVSSIAEVGNCKVEMIVQSIEGNKELEIRFNSIYLMEALGAIEDEIIKICFTAQIQPAIMQAVDGSTQYKYLIVPIAKRAV